MLQQVRLPLLSIIYQSTDFEAAYNALISMAARLFPIDPAAAESLLLELSMPTRNAVMPENLREYFKRQRRFKGDARKIAGDLK